MFFYHVNLDGDYVLGNGQPRKLRKHSKILLHCAHQRLNLSTTSFGKFKGLTLQPLIKIFVTRWIALSRLKRFTQVTRILHENFKTSGHWTRHRDLFCPFCHEAALFARASSRALVLGREAAALSTMTSWPHLPRLPSYVCQIIGSWIKAGGVTKSHIWRRGHYVTAWFQGRE